ncbi:DUF2398 family protein [Streptomyces sp. NPDC048272]|uniref:DUF2398 family protein n=1 Tax=Streptomyces sp. NPDC048272 TaxID=3154616 RepID=UPI00342324E0
MEEEQGEEVAALARHLAVQPWLLGEHDEIAIEAVHRNLQAVRGVLGNVGWSLNVEPDLVRVHKPVVWKPGMAPEGASPVGCWFWLTVAALESVRPRVGLGDVVAAARAMAAEAGVPVTQSATELRALLEALRMLRSRGLLEEVGDGRIEALLEQENPAVLLRVHHARLLHALPRNVPLDEFGQWTVDPAKDPGAWLEGLEGPLDLSQRMCGMLADQAVVHACDLSGEERQWLSDRLASEGAEAAAGFGLELERRVEGAAFVMPSDAYTNDRELGGFVFPRHKRGGTVGHAALLLIDHVVEQGERGGVLAPGEGWCGMCEPEIVRHLSELSVQHTRWADEYRQAPRQLGDHVQKLLEPADLLRVSRGYENWWWLSPAAARWTVMSGDPDDGGAAVRSTQERVR